MWTSSRRPIARFSASAFESPRWRRSVSVIWVPIVSVGLSDVIGSWKIIEICLPRMSSSALSAIVVRSRPSKRIAPETTRPGDCTRPMIERDVTDLPQPDSPTIPSTDPSSTSNETPSTARTSPSRVLKWVRRSSTSSSANSGFLRPRIERVAQAVGDEESAEDEPGDADGGDHDDVRVCLIGGVAVLRERAPGRLRRVDPEPQERQERLAEDHARQLEEDEDDDHAERVHQEVPVEHAWPLGADRVRGPDVVVRFQRKDLSAHHASGGEPGGDRRRDDIVQKFTVPNTASVMIANGR